jgi:2'-hydroxyisoflavone reductase
VNILVVGGTKFVGRAFTEAAVRRGHGVTVFHRGETEPVGLPDAEHIHGDRNKDLGALKGRTWDAALDTCAYVPRSVRELAEVLGDAVDIYAFVSTLSVHAGDIPEKATEGTALHRPPYPDTEQITGETYGPLKAASEAEALRAFPGRCLIIRPGYIVGPSDPTERFISYVRRAAGGGEMLAPGPPDAPFQVVDVRDLAGFMLERIEAGEAETYGVVGPPQPVTFEAVLEMARAVARADTELTWVSEEFLRRFGKQVESWLPMWHPDSPGAHTYDMRKAVAAGLRHRPLDETIHDTLAWDRGRGVPDLPGRLTASKERVLLGEWRAQGGEDPQPPRGIEAGSHTENVEP